MSGEWIREISERYIELYQTITGSMLDRALLPLASLEPVDWVEPVKHWLETNL